MFSCTLPVCVHEGGQTTCMNIAQLISLKLHNENFHTNRPFAWSDKAFFVLKLSNMNDLEKKGQKLS